MRRAFHLAGEEINGRAQSNRNGHTQLPIMHRHPFLLLRAAETYEEDVRLCFANAAGDLLVIHFEQ